MLCPNRTLTVLASALLISPLAACTGDGAGDGTGVDVEHLLSLMNDTEQLSVEVDNAFKRLVVECMEDQGFDLHNPNILHYEPVKPTEQLESPIDRSVPTVDDAAEDGFGWWRWSPQGMDESGFSPMEHWEDAHGSAPDNGYWEADAAYQREWQRAAHGEKPEDHTLGYLGDGPDAVTGGCEQEIGTAVFGEPVLQELHGHRMWQWRPSPPTYDFDWLAGYRAYRGMTVDEERDFLECVEHAGHGEWDLDFRGDFDPWLLFMELYGGELFHTIGYDEGRAPTVPATPDPLDTSDIAFAEYASVPRTGIPPRLEELAPSTWEAVRDYEFELAVDAAVCADETGFREAAALAEAEMLDDLYSAVEDDLYAWQEQMRGYLDTAQDLLLT